MNIGKKLKLYRKSRGLSQEDLAYLAGVNDKYYGRLERNESCPTIDMLIRICEALNIDIVEFFLYKIEKNDDEQYFNQEATRIILEGLREGIDIHFNRDNIIIGCEKSIWYNGFIGSMNFDEFEFQLFADGNIKAKLYIEGEEVLELNSDNISQELQKYVQNDAHINELIEYMPFDNDILKEKGGNAFFVTESNWLTAKLINNSSGEILNTGIILDSDNIFDFFRNKQTLIEYVFWK